MRRVLPSLLLALAPVAGCSDDGGSSGGGPAAADREPVVPVTPVPADDVVTPDSTAALGRPLTIAGTEDDTAVRVVALAYKRGVEGADELDIAGRGNRLDAVQFRVTNAGSATYDDAPTNGARLTDSTGRQYEAELATTTKAGPDFADDLSLRPGAMATGWAAFRVPATTQITRIVFTTDSGFGDTGEWATR